MNIIFKLLASLALLAIAAAAPAQNLSFTYQGQLQNSGQPFTGSVDLEFELFADPDGDFLLDVDTHPGHPVSNGLFQVLLSFDLPTTRGVPEIEILPMYLGVTVNGQTLSPPQAITPAPTANVSAYAVHALSAGAPWTIAGDDLQYMNGRVGVGRAPSDHFVIDSGLTQQDDDYDFGTGALRVMVREPGTDIGITKLRVLGNGGVAIGNSYNSSGVPVDGLRVQGRAVFESQGRFNGGLTLGESGDLSILGLQASVPNNGDVCYTRLLPPVGPDIFRLGTCASSARYKDNIQPLGEVMGLIRQLTAVSFNWSEDGQADIGLIAEDVAEVEPRLAYFNGDGKAEGVNYRHLAAVLVAAIQQQEAETIAALAMRDAEIAALRDELETQRLDTAARLAALEAVHSDGHQLAGGR